MQKDPLDKEIEEAFRKDSHKTTQQKIKELELSQSFQKDIAGLRIKYPHIVKEYNVHFDEGGKKITESVFEKHNLEERINNNEFKSEQEALDVTFDLIANLPQKDKEELAVIQIKATHPIIDKQFNQDVLAICKKYKTYPIEDWFFSILTYVLFEHLLPPDMILGSGLEGYFSREQIMALSQDLNFRPKIVTNTFTGEKKLTFEMFPDTTLKGDMKKHWNLLEKIQRILNKEKGIKRFYPKKNLPIVEKVSEMPTKIHDEIDDKIVKNTNIAKALEIYPDTPFAKEAEERAGNRLKQIKHRHK